MARNFSSFSGSWTIIESPKPFYSNWQRQRRIKVKVRESKFYLLNVHSGKWFVICDILKGKWGKSWGTISKLYQIIPNTLCRKYGSTRCRCNLGLKQLFCCSHRRPIYNVAFHFKDVPLSLPRNNTIILISGCMACSAVFLCFLWDTNSLRDNLQTATDVENTTLAPEVRSQNT